jgi:hypothetical protein
MQFTRRLFHFCCGQRRSRIVPSDGAGLDGVSIKTCASMSRVWVPTANRIIAKFRAYDESAESLAREFRERLDALR